MAKFAVLISGGVNPAANFPRYLNDLREMYRTLRDVYRYARANIFVLYADGQPQDLDGDGASEIWGPATLARLNNLFRTDLPAVLTSNDFLFIFTSNHGGRVLPPPSQRVRLWLWGGSIEDRDFARLVNALPVRNLAVCMGQCFSGGFIDDLAGPDRVVATACHDNEVTWACDTEGPFDEFLFHWTAAVRGQTPNGQGVDADTDNDGWVSLREAFDYANRMDSRPETPQYYEGVPGLGSRLTLFGEESVATQTAYLQNVWSAGVCLGWANVYIATDIQPGSADLSSYIRRFLIDGREHARLAAIFVNPEPPFDEALAIMNTEGVNQRLANAVSTHLFRLDGQLRDFTGFVPGYGGRVSIRDIYAAGVNLAWAQVYTQHEIDIPAVRKYLTGAKAHARNANIFTGYERYIDEARRLLDATGLTVETAKAIETALAVIGNQLIGLTCIVEMS